MPLVSCPECRRSISDRAPVCPHCGFPVASSRDAPSQVAQPMPAIAAAAAPCSTSTSLLAIAYWQKLLLYALLISVLSQLPIYYCLQVPALAALGLLGFLANACWGMWCFYKLGMALEMPVPLIVLFSIGLCLPGVALLAMLVVTQRATTRLKLAGIRVGLLGANLNKILS